MPNENSPVTADATKSNSDLVSAEPSSNLAVPLDEALSQLQAEIGKREIEADMHLAIFASNEGSNPSVWRELSKNKSDGCLIAVGCAASLALINADYWANGTPRFVLLFDNDPVVVATTKVIIQALAQFTTFEEFADFIHEQLLKVVQPLSKLHRNMEMGTSDHISPSIDVWLNLRQNFQLFHQLASSGQMQIIHADIDDPAIVETLQEAAPEFSQLQNIVYASNVVNYYASSQSGGEQGRLQQMERVRLLNAALMRMAGNPESRLVCSDQARCYLLRMAVPPQLDTVPADLDTILNYRSPTLRQVFDGDKGIMITDEVEVDCRRLIWNILSVLPDGHPINEAHAHFGTMTPLEWARNRYGDDFAELFEKLWPKVMDEKRQFAAEMERLRSFMQSAD